MSAEPPTMTALSASLRSIGNPSFLWQATISTSAGPAGVHRKHTRHWSFTRMLI